MSSLIKLKDINKYYKVGKEKFHVLKSLNINIEEGDFVMIMGKSGSGKTTLLNVLAFLDKFDTGSYFFNYENVSNLNVLNVQFLGINTSDLFSNNLT